jgi:deoxyribodipyrimidine photo-lyase
VGNHSFASLRQFRPAGDPFAMRVTTAEPRARGEHVLYVMRAARRLRANLALDYALTKARALKLPLVVCESPEPGATARQHAFLLDGVRVNERDAALRRIRYVYAPKGPGVLSREARLIVTDEHPLLPPLDGADHVDGNGMLPMRAFGKEQYSAKFLRDRAHKLFPELWVRLPGKRHAPSPALQRVDAFLAAGLDDYAAARNRDVKHASGLSPYLRFGHLGIHELAERVLASDAADEDVDAFLEQAVIRRELSFNLCFYNPRYASLDALPDWAKRTLDEHRGDRRKPLYDYGQFERAETHDEVWNVAQRQLLGCGVIHNYLRMLWGKKIIEWSATPEEAFATMVRLHDEYALDGRDPNTYAGILWCFGKHDRPWAPERPIFGSVRWMSSEQTAKKVRMNELDLCVPE